MGRSRMLLNLVVRNWEICSCPLWWQIRIRFPHWGCILHHFTRLNRSWSIPDNLIPSIIPSNYHSFYPAETFKSYPSILAQLPSYVTFLFFVQEVKFDNITKRIQNLCQVWTAPQKKSPKAVNLFVKTPSFLYKKHFTHLIRMVKRFEADLHQLHEVPMLSGLKSGLHRSCVDHAEGLEFYRILTNLDRWHSWTWCQRWSTTCQYVNETNCLEKYLGKVRSVCHFLKKNAQNSSAANHCNNCKRNLLLLTCKKTQSPGERQKAYRHFYTLCSNWSRW